MSLKSRPGCSPCVYIFNANVTKSTFPVRSPLPNRQPSMRSPPASKPSSAAAIPLPRSLCGCRLMTTCSRTLMLSHIHSIWSAYTLGIAASIVAGRLRITGFAELGSSTSITASHTSRLNSSSAVENVSGLYSKCQSVSGYFAACSLRMLAPSTAIALTPALSRLKTISRHAGLTAL